MKIDETKYKYKWININEYKYKWTKFIKIFNEILIKILHDQVVFIQECNIGSPSNVIHYISNENYMIMSMDS